MRRFTAFQKALSKKNSKQKIEFFVAAAIVSLLLIFILGASMPTVGDTSADASEDPQPAPIDQLTSSSGSVTVVARILPSRLIVVDDEDKIIEIWSNTPGADYTLRAREGYVDGSEHPLTEGIKSQYNKLLPTIDWSKKGLVYSR